MPSQHNFHIKTGGIRYTPLHCSSVNPLYNLGVEQALFLQNYAHTKEVPVEPLKT